MRPGRLLTSAIVLLALPLFAQKPPSGGTGGTGGSTPPTPSIPTTPPIPRIPTNPTISPRDNGSPNSLYLTGRVLVDQGSVPPESVIVEEWCGNTVRARTRTDLRGTFTLSLGQAASQEAYVISDISEQRDMRNRIPSTQIAGCDLRAVLGGYISTELHLEGGNGAVGVLNVGTIFLKRITGSTSPGSTVSVTSYQVPDKARKEYEKAIKLADNNTKRAEEHLLKAVGLYPKYAAAWVLLGEFQKREREFQKAKESFLHAQEADPAYVPPYVHLAYLAANEKDWKATLNLSEQAIRLDPVDYPDAYFLSAVAHYNLHQFPDSRRAALKAAEMDKVNRLPRVHYLLAAIFESTGDPVSAITELDQYLKLDPVSKEAETARQQLQRLKQQAQKAASR